MKNLCLKCIKKNKFMNWNATKEGEMKDEYEMHPIAI